MKKNTKYTIGFVVLEKGWHLGRSLEGARPREEWE